MTYRIIIRWAILITLCPVYFLALGIRIGAEVITNSCEKLAVVLHKWSHLREYRDDE